jgi:arylsulfatase A-like enzyme
VRPARAARARLVAAARVALVAVTRPHVLGAVYMLALVGWSSSKPAEEVPQRGAKDTGAGLVLKLLTQAYHDEIVRLTIAFVGAAVGIGALLGLAAWGLVWLRASLVGERPSPRRTALSAAPIVALLHAWILATHMATWPQLYDRSWVHGEEWQRSAIHWLTDEVGAGTASLVGVAAIALWVLGPLRVALGPRRIAELGRRLARLGRRRAVRALVAAACVVAITFTGRHRVIGWLRGDPSRPSVLILAADSLRLDRLEPRVAPRLSAFADRGVRFENAFTPLPRTLSSWTSMLTGRWPHHHGVRTMFARWEDRGGLDALPSRLAKDGYRTTVVSDYAGDMFRLADYGFERSVSPVQSAREVVRGIALGRVSPLLPFLHTSLTWRLYPAVRGLTQGSDPEMVADDAIAELCRLDERPEFTTVFFSTTHFPYAAPWPYYQRFTTPGYEGAFKYEKKVSFAREQMTTPANIRQIRGLYDGAVASVDAAAGRVLDALDACGLAKSTIVVVTSDHGEILFEDGHDQGHGDTLFSDQALRVPLAIVDPRAPAARREAAVVRNIDLAPTLYALTGTTPPADLDGRSLAPALRGEPLAPTTTFAETGIWMTEWVDLPPGLRIPYPPVPRSLEVDFEHGDEIVVRRDVAPATIVARHRMVHDARYKLVYAPARDGAHYFLYDLARDPSGLHDVAPEEPALARRYEDELWAWMLEDPRVVRRDGWLVPVEEAW